jgi:hypothetical protein
MSGEVYDGAGYRIADPTRGPHLHCDYNSDDGHWANLPRAYIEREEDEEIANAALIVRAVNERDELIAVLREATDKLCHYATDYPQPDALAIINRSDRLLARGHYWRAALDKADAP